MRPNLAAPVTSDIAFSGAAQLASAIQSRTVSAAEVVEAHLAQIARHNPVVNAVVTMDIDLARRRAREADDALARGVVWGPLHGVPFVLKDAFATAGMRTTTGFAPLDHVPNEDSTVAGRLKGAGAILLGKTNVAELLADFQTSNAIFGRSNNPWNLERTPGGSSGGAAAAVAAGMAPFDIGTDMASSIRLPAHFCGVFGLKPTEHRVSLMGVVPSPHAMPRPVRVMSCIGPIARNVDDLALLHGIIAGPNGDTDVPPMPIDPVESVTLRDLRVAVAPTFGTFPVAADVHAAVRALATELEPLCAKVEERLPDLDFTLELSRAGELIGMAVGAFAQNQKRPATVAQYLTALHVRDRSILAWERFFEHWDVLLCPPAMTAAFAHCEPGTPLAVDGRTEEYHLVCAHGTLFNYSGNPAVVLPYRLTRDGLPVGVQFVAKRWSESRLLGAAGAIAELTPQFMRPPGF